MLLNPADDNMEDDANDGQFEEYESDHDDSCVNAYSYNGPDYCEI